MVSESFCRICLQNLLQKYGTSVATVPLFLETCNKEFCNVLCGNPVILAQLLLDLKIIVSHDGSCSAQEMCQEGCQLLQTARGVKKKAFVVDSAVEKGKGKWSTNSNERKIFSSTPAIPDWSHSEG